MRKRIATGLLVLATLLPALSAQSRKEAQERKKEAVAQEVASGNYRIDVNAAMPVYGRFITLGSPYSLEVRNDTVVSRLPYFGRAYSLPYGGGGGLNFKAPLKEYTLKTGRKGSRDIRFTARTVEDFLEFNIQIYPNGSADIQVNAQNRQSIRFTGEMDLRKRE